MNPEDMEEAEAQSYWLELEEEGYRIMEGESKEESEEVATGDGWFTGGIQEVDRTAGDYPDSRLYRLRHEAVDGQVCLWGKADIDQKVDNAALSTGDTIALSYEGDVSVSTEEGQRDMGQYSVRYDKV